MSMPLGDVVEEFLAGNPGEVTLIAPFIKVRPVRRLLAACEGRDLLVYTRWLPTEVAMGVSDLEVLEWVEAAGGQLHLLRELHAKAFVAGDVALVGSANITDAALGWSNQPNLEALVRVAATDPAVADLLRHVRELAIRADEQVRAHMSRAAEAVDLSVAHSARPRGGGPAEAASDGGWEDLEDEEQPLAVWVPESTDPGLFVSHLVHGETLTRDAEARAMRDAHYLDVRSTGNRDVFIADVKAALQQTGFVTTITTALDNAQSEQPARDAFFSRAGIDESDEFAEAHWQHAVGWLLYFFPDRYERVAVRSDLRPVARRRYLGRY